MTPRWWEGTSFCWCACEEEEVGKSLMLSGLSQAPPWQHRMLNLSTSRVPLHPSPNSPGPPNCATTVCSEQQAWLIVLMWDDRLQWSRAWPPDRYPKAAPVNVIWICCYHFCHFLTHLFAAFVLFFSSQINNLPLIAFSALDTIFSTLIPTWFFSHHCLHNPGVRWHDS